MTFLTVLMVIVYVRDYGSFMSIAGLAMFYAVAAHASNRRHRWLAIVTSAVVLVGVAVFTLLDRSDGLRIGRPRRC